MNDSSTSLALGRFRVIVWALYCGTTLGLCILTRHYLVIRLQTAPWLQLMIVGLLGLNLGYGCWWLFQRLGLIPRIHDKADGILACTLATAFALTWGRQIFISFFYHDEIGYFAVVNQNWSATCNWIFEPLNEHFQPLLKLSLVFFCDFWGINNYFGIAFATFATGLALCVTFYAFLRQATDNTGLAFLATGFFACASNFADVYQYKGAGFPILASILFLLLTLVQVLPPGSLAGPWAPRIGRTWLLRFVVCVVATIFFSSLLTIPLCFLLPFLLKGQRNGKASADNTRQPAWIRLLALSALALLPSLVFYLLRWKLRIAPPHYLNTIEAAPLLKMIGSFASQPFGAPATSATAVGIGVVVLSIFTAIALLVRELGPPAMAVPLRRAPPALLSLLAFGLAVSIISAAQVFAGRGFQLAGIGFHRYEIFPVIGTLCATVAIAAYAWHYLGDAQRRLSLPLSLAASAGLLVFSVASHYRMDRLASWPLKYCIEVNLQRRDFFDQLDRVLQEVRYRNLVNHGYSRQSDFDALPDLRIERDSLGLENTYFLQHYARALASSHYDVLLVPFAAPNPQHRALFINRAGWPETTGFLTRYFPRQTAAIMATPPEGAR